MTFRGKTTIPHVVNILPSRRNTERLDVADAYLARLDARIDRLETSGAEVGDLASLRDRVALTVESDRANAERIGQLGLALEDLQTSHKEIVIAVSEGIERTDRAERRIKATVKRARAELAERGLLDPALESEDHELREVDGGRGKRDGLLPVQPKVASPAEQASSIRGVSVEALRKVRGFYGQA